MATAHGGEGTSSPTVGEKDGTWKMYLHGWRQPPCESYITKHPRSTCPSVSIRALFICFNIYYWKCGRAGYRASTRTGVVSIDQGDIADKRLSINYISHPNRQLLLTKASSPSPTIANYISHSNRQLLLSKPWEANFDFLINNLMPTIIRGGRIPYETK